MWVRSRSHARAHIFKAAVLIVVAGKAQTGKQKSRFSMKSGFFLGNAERCGQEFW